MKKLSQVPKYTIKDGVTQSMLATFLGCRERSRLILNRWQGISNSVNALNRGDFIHWYLEHVYKSGGYEIAKMFDMWVTKNNLQGDPGIDEIYQTCQHLLPNYLKYWQKQDAKIKWLGLEKTFDVSWRGFRLRGKIDGILEYTNNPGSVWVLETKTKAQIDEDSIIDALGFDFQNLFYLTVLNECLGIKARGVVYNVIRWPSLRKDADARLKGDIESRMTHYYKRFEVAYSPQTIDRFKQELEAKLKDFSLWCEGKLSHYKNETACFKGNMKCEFLKICSSGKFIGFKQGRILFRELL